MKTNKNLKFKLATENKCSRVEISTFCSSNILYMTQKLAIKRMMVQGDICVVCEEVKYRYDKGMLAILLQISVINGNSCHNSDIND